MSVEFVLEGAGAPDVDGLARELRARIERCEIRRGVWLDTHDWRLFRAGLVLHRQVRRRGSWLELSGLDGGGVTRAVAPPGRSFTVRDLPAGPLRDAVLGPVGVRALLPRAAATGPLQVLAVLDGEEKTVARLVVEGPYDVADGGVVPGRVRVTALRGYGKDARRVTQRLCATPGIRPATEPLIDAVLRARGLDPRDYPGKVDRVSSRRLPAADAFAGALAQLCRTVSDNVEGTVGQVDTEYLHDLRVAVRTSRALLKFAVGVVEEDLRARYAADLKWLAQATSASRDLDVYLLGFDAMAERGGRVADLEPFREQLTGRCREAHAALNRTLRSARFAALLAGWERELAVPRPVAGPSPPIIEVADARLARAWKRVERRGNAITDNTPPHALHDLRKRCKELRYLLELFGGLYDPGTLREAVTELKRLQDNLGEFQDAEAQLVTVRTNADELAREGVRASALMAMGRLEQHLEARQHAAWREFADRWRRFDRRHNRRLFDAMVRTR